MNEKEEAVRGIVKECWRSLASIGVGFIFDDIASVFTPKTVKRPGRIVRSIGAFTLADAVCDRLTDPYIDKRFAEMEEKINEKRNETEDANQEA